MTNKVRHRKRPKKPLLSVDLANLPGPKPDTEEGHDGKLRLKMSEVSVDFSTMLSGDISETDEEGNSAVKSKKSEKCSDQEEKRSEAVEVKKNESSTVNLDDKKAEAKSLSTKEDALKDPAPPMSSAEKLIELKDEVIPSDYKPDKRKLKKNPSTFNEKNEKFQYGNYNQYYGYR